jgi:hypothetical protein
MKAGRKAGAKEEREIKEERKADAKEGLGGV